MKSRWRRRFSIFFAVLCALYLILLIPESSPPEPTDGDKNPFLWNQDAYWATLEARFKELRLTGCENLESGISADFDRLDSLLAKLAANTLAPEAPVFDEIETAIFELGTLIAACPDRLPEYTETFRTLRTLAKNLSIHWDINSRPARDRLYRLLYGGRAAVEEAMMQSPAKVIPEVVMGSGEPSATPSAEILGVTIHSGDILVSRGGAPTSALIARGNDYPGNFSHTALAYVDEHTGEISIIESHIEIGVAIADMDAYLRDKKLRIMVLRPRADLPALQKDPMLPHKAAAYALQRAQTEHIPYDFAMNTKEYVKLFCSEVISEAYDRQGVSLWMGLSHISSVGVKSWLGAFGVEYFITQEPSDLEYDPQLRVVAEWRDFETLYDDRLDNAVVDALLEGAEQGDRIEYDWYMLPIGRVLKAYSVLLNQFDKVGPIPEGMSATSALRNDWFSRKHRKIKANLRELAERFASDKGYSPPYWELFRLAKQAAAS